MADFTDKVAEVIDFDEDSLQDVDTIYDPIDDESVVTYVSDNEDGSKVVSISYVTHDEMGGDVNEFWGDESHQCKFEEFRAQTDRDDFIKANLKRMPLIVNRYKHSNVHYSVINTRQYPDMQWDVAPCAVIVPSKDMLKEYRKQVKAGVKQGLDADVVEAGALADIKKKCNVLLDEYSSWCNGEVYGVVHEYFIISPDGEVTKDENQGEVSWGYVGYDYAVRSMKEDIPNPVEKSGQEITI